jgi:uroporphyrinogen-III synthase
MSEENRRLFERQGATVLVAPALKEVALADQTPAVRFGVELLQGGVDVLVLLTGVGARLLIDVLCSHHERSEVLAAIQRCTLVCRGPKPVAALKGYGLKAHVVVPEPNTWRDVVTTMQQSGVGLGKRIYLQEYGRSNEQLLSALGCFASAVSAVTLYAWSLPDDTAPIEAAIETIVAGNADVVCFTAGVQVDHLFEVATRIGRVDSLRHALGERTVIASIGPMTTERLKQHGLSVDIEPVHPKLGHLVLAIAERAGQVLRLKSQRAGLAQNP